MKILVVSDTHGRLDNLEYVLEKVKPIDLLIHLGDVCRQEDYIEALADCPCEIVAGNNDIFSTLPRVRELKLGNYRIHLEHGHRLPYSIEGMRREAADLQCDILMSGHTHRPLIDEADGIWLVNPGSISLPRQEGHNPTYIIMEIDKKGCVHFTLKKL